MRERGYATWAAGPFFSWGLFSCFHLRGGVEITSLVGTLSGVPHLHAHLPGKDSQMARGHALAPWGSLPPPRLSPAGAGTRGSPGRWMEAQVSHSSSLVLALGRLSNSCLVNYVPFLKKSGLNKWG